MYKKLSEQKQQEILEIGITEFARAGLDNASISLIAKRAEVSVGVLYKYYANKEDFYLACVSYVSAVINREMDRVLSKEGDLASLLEQLIRLVVRYIHEHPEYFAVYHEITQGNHREYTRKVANEIETVSARAFQNLLAVAQAEGRIRPDADIRLFSFFLDTLIMNLEFSLSCEYYRERFRIFCGEDVMGDEEKIVSQMMKFIESAFAVSKIEFLQVQGEEKQNDLRDRL